MHFSVDLYHQFIYKAHVGKKQNTLITKSGSSLCKRQTQLHHLKYFMG